MLFYKCKQAHGAPPQKKKKTSRQLRATALHDCTGNDGNTFSVFQGFRWKKNSGDLLKCMPAKKKQDITATQYWHVHSMSSAPHSVSTWCEYLRMLSEKIKYLGMDTVMKFATCFASKTIIEAFEQFSEQVLQARGQQCKYANYGTRRFAYIVSSARQITCISRKMGWIVTPRRCERHVLFFAGIHFSLSRLFFI